MLKNRNEVQVFDSVGEDYDGARSVQYEGKCWLAYNGTAGWRVAPTKAKAKAKVHQWLVEDARTEAEANNLSKSRYVALAMTDTQYVEVALCGEVDSLIRESSVVLLDGDSQAWERAEDLSGAEEIRDAIYELYRTTK